MNELTLQVEKVSKKFCLSLKRSLWYGIKDLTGEMLLRQKEHTKLRRLEFWALRDISFELHQGETLGLIGSNGAGKSTLLKLVNGLIKPDTGCISVHGRVGALIQLGAGFNPVLTGRENIYISAAVLGLRQKEVDRLLNQIIDFAEIGDFINTPVRAYSSGMKVRLGFAVAINMNPDIFLIDEVLAVGDSSFRQRCIDRLIEYKRNGGTIIFISHNTVTVEAISDRVMVLDHGHVVEIGEPFEVIQRYESWQLELSRQAEIRLGEKLTAADTGTIRITAVECYDMSGSLKSEFMFGEPFEVRLQYEADGDIRQPHFIIGVRKGSGEEPVVSLMHMLWDGISLEDIPQRGVVGCTIEAPSLSPGTYRFLVAVQAAPASAFGQKWYAPRKNYGSFTVLPDGLQDRFPGIPAVQLVSRIPPMILLHSWTLNGHKLSNTEDKFEADEQKGR